MPAGFARCPGRKLLTLVGVLALVLGGLAVLLLSMLRWEALPNTAAAATAPTLYSCNSSAVAPPSDPVFPGSGSGTNDKQVTCSVTIENTIGPLGATSSTVTTSVCMSAAGVTWPSCTLIGTASGGPIITVTASNQLVTSVNQCNYIVEAGGSNVICDVTVINNIPVGTTTSGVTVDQCIGSGTGVGAATPVCSPPGSTTNATVTQCNGSATGGGTYAGQPVENCNVPDLVTAVPLTINQCNSSVIGGGSAVTCTTTITNEFSSGSTTTTTAPGSTTTRAPGSTTTRAPGVVARFTG